MKRPLSKAANKGEDAYLAMLAYRAAPLDGGKSPAELLFGRKRKTRLPYQPETYARNTAPHDRGKLLTALQPNDYNLAGACNSSRPQWTEIIRRAL